MQIIEDPFNVRIRKILDSRDLTPASAAELTGITRPSFYGWLRPLEEGGYYPQLDGLLTLVTALELSQDETLYLFGVENES